MDRDVRVVNSPRGRLTTVLIAGLLGASAGFLWIGRGRFAVAAFVLELLFAAALLLGVFLLGAPAWLPRGLSAGGLDLTVLLGRAAISGALVLPFRSRSQPDRWFSRGWGLALLYLGSLAVASTVAVTVRGFIAQPFTTPSASMAPTLFEGDMFFASKSAYGWGPFSLPLAILPNARIRAALPERGDVAVFRTPDGSGADGVKRVIGLPGDRMALSGGVIVLNGAPLPREATGWKADDGFGQEAAVIRETLPDGRTYLTLESRADGMTDEAPEIVIPAGALFVLGDNRDNSVDSRIFGLVPIANLLGRAERIYWNERSAAFADRRDLRANR